MTMEEKHTEDHSSEPAYEYPAESVYDSEGSSEAESEAVDAAHDNAQDVEPEAPSFPGAHAWLALKVQWRKNPRLFVIITAVILAIILLKVFVSERHVIQQPAVKSVSVVAPVIKTVTRVPAHVNNELSRLEENDTASKNNLSSMQMQIVALQSAVTTLTQQESVLNKSLRNVSDGLASLAEARATKMHKKEVKHAKPIVYHIRAIVPGRVWVDGSNGHSVSLTVGNRLPVYGVVTKILANRGMVLTSSGKVIEFKA